MFSSSTQVQKEVDLGTRMVILYLLSLEYRQMTDNQITPDIHFPPVV